MTIREALSIFKIPDQYSQMLNNLIEGGIARIKINNILSNKINIVTGVGQGDPLSSLR